MHIKFWSCGTWLSKIVKTLNTCIALCLLAGLAFGQRDQKAEDLRLYGGKTISLCAPDDPICSGGGNIMAHVSYIEYGMTAQAATFAANKLR